MAEVIPHMFDSNLTSFQNVVHALILKFDLNHDQAMAFEIVTCCTFQRQSPNHNQLLMGIFGEGGTGKSQVIDAIREWFLVCKCFE